MRVHIATDHAGLDLSHHLMQKLTEHGYEMIDHGPQEYDPADDYPAFCISAALGVREDRANGCCVAPPCCGLRTTCTPTTSMPTTWRAPVCVRCGAARHSAFTTCVMTRN